MELNEDFSVKDETFDFTVRIRSLKLETGEIVRIYEEDYKRLMKQGVSPEWFLNENGAGTNAYVRFHSKTRSNVSQVARVVLGLERVGKTKNMRVGYRDRDPLNLCRHNLVLIAPG